MSAPLGREPQRPRTTQLPVGLRRIDCPGRLRMGWARSARSSMLTAARLAVLLLVWARSAGAQDASTASRNDEVLETPFCVLNPVFIHDSDQSAGSSDGSAPEVFDVALQATLSMQLAVEHVNNAVCGILGPGCEALLDAGGGRRVRLKPYLHNVRSNTPEGAPPAVQACASTDAAVVATGFTSEQTSLVASFVGGLGRLMLAQAATSPAFARKELYPNFARTAPNSAANVIATAHLVQHFGWKDVVVMYNQDEMGNQAIEVFAEQVRTLKSLDPQYITVGAERSHAELLTAGQRLVDSGVQIVVLSILPYELLRFLSAMKAVITAAGLDYKSYTWIVSTFSTRNVMAYYSAPEVQQQPALFEGLLGVDVGYSATGRSWLAAELRQVAPQYAYAKLAEYYMNDTETWADQITMANFAEVISAGSHYVHELSLNMYDAVWSIAIGTAAASAAKWNGTADSRAVTGSEVMAVVKTGRFPSFQGAAGRRAFLPSGDWDLDHTDILVTNYGTPPGSSAARHAVVAAVHVATFEVNLMEEPVLWSNGQLYPYVPSDGVSFSPFPVFIASAVIGLCFLVAVILALVWRNLRLKNRVDTLMNQAREEVPLESPLGKMLEFLRQYEDKGRARPTRSAARQLAELIAAQSNALTVPDLEALTDVDSGIKAFLLSNARQGREFKRITTLTSFGSEAEGGSSAARVSDFMETDDLESYGNFRAELLESWASVPADLMGKIANDLFLDFVTPRSPFKECPSPLRVVVYQSAVRLDLLRSAEAQRHLLNFSQRVEAGYADSLYHCKHHGADVTQRLMTIVHMSGLASLQAYRDTKQSSSVGLVSLVAAMVHDYGHPQVNNTFLEEEEDAMALEFNYQAPAEHYALRETMKLLSDPSFDFISREEDDPRVAARRRKSFRKMVVNLVLGTDMSRHFDLVSQFEAQVVNNRELQGKSTAEMWRAMDQKQRVLVLQIALKVADIGHCALPWDIHKEWLQRLEDEFFAQGDRELAGGYKVSPLMDRQLPGPTAANNQVGFNKVIVIPLLKAWTAVFPSCSALLEQAQGNMARYTALCQQAAAAASPSKPGEWGGGEGAPGGPPLSPSTKLSHMGRRDSAAAAAAANAGFNTFAEARPTRHR